MADLDIAIAGRSYRVACADGEEDNLTRAAALLADEAEILREQFGDRFAGIPESRVLLMTSLMLGDRFRATLDAAAMAPAPDDDLAPGAPDAQQRGFFDDTLAARVAELEAELAEAREAEATALAALEDAAARVRTLAAEIQEDVDLEDDEDEDADEGDAAPDDEEDPAEDAAEGDDLEDEEENEAEDDLAVSLTLDVDEDADDAEDEEDLDPEAADDDLRR